MLCNPLKYSVQGALSAVSCGGTDRAQGLLPPNPREGLVLIAVPWRREPLCPAFCFSPLERGWRKQKDGALAQPKVRLRQEVVSVSPQKRGQRIAVPVRKLFAKEKRPYGLGMVGKLTNRTYRKRIDSYVKRQIEDMDDHRWELQSQNGSQQLASERLLLSLGDSGHGLGVVG